MKYSQSLSTLEGYLKKVLAKLIQLKEVTLRRILGVRGDRTPLLAAKNLGGQVIGGLEKGFEAGKLLTPPKHIVNGVDISKAAGYVGLKAAVAKSRLTLELVAIVEAALVVALIFYALDLNKQLKLKHYLMVPAEVKEITEVAPQTLPPGRVHMAFVHFLDLLGNVGPSNVKEHYQMLKSHMSPSLRIKFDLETEPVIDHITKEGLSEYIEVSGEKTIEPDGKGWFRATAPIKVFSALRGRKMKARNEYVVMRLKIVAPRDRNTWGLQIEDMKRISASSYDNLSRSKNSKVFN